MASLFDDLFCANYIKSPKGMIVCWKKPIACLFAYIDHQGDRIATTLCESCANERMNRGNYNIIEVFWDGTEDKIELKEKLKVYATIDQGRSSTQTTNQ